MLCYDVIKISCWLCITVQRPYLRVCILGDMTALFLCAGLSSFVGTKEPISQPKSREASGSLKVRCLFTRGFKQGMSRKRASRAPARPHWSDEIKGSLLNSLPHETCPIMRAMHLKSKMFRYIIIDWEPSTILKSVNSPQLLRMFNV